MKHMSRAAGALANVQVKTPLYIGGEWVSGEGVAVASVDPFTEELLATVRGASLAQADRAVASAAAGAREWRAASPVERGFRIAALRDVMSARADELAGVVVAETGQPISLARSLQVGVSIDQVAWLADAAVRGPRGGWRYALPDYDGPFGPSKSVVRRAPVGVVAAITPYNIPYVAAVLKAVTAIAAGCSVILLPSPRAQMCAIAFARVVADIGLPPGVFNLILGGPDIGRRLTESEDVALVTFTGSDAVGRQVIEQGAKTIKRVVLELGGKSPNIILPGADMEKHGLDAMMRFSRGAGQGCISLTRTLVPRSDYVAFVDAARQCADGIAVGDPWEAKTIVGPLISREHRDRVEGYVQRALDAGARIEAGGGRPAIDRGFFMNPTLIGGISNNAEIAQDELFGPVGVVLPYDSIDDAVAMANDSRYGLNANVMGPHEEALAVAERLESGMVAVNGGGWFRPDAPFGGYKMSGLGREYGEYGFEEFFETQHIHWPA